MVQYMKKDTIEGKAIRCSIADDQVFVEFAGVRFFFNPDFPQDAKKLLDAFDTVTKVIVLEEKICLQEWKSTQDEENEYPEQTDDPYVYDRDGE